MAKKSKTRVIGRGVDYINLPKENQQYASQPAASSNLVNTQQNNGNIYGSQYTTTGPTGAAQVTQTTSPLTGTTTTKSYEQHFQTSPLTNSYQSKMLGIENDRPDDFEWDTERPAAFTWDKERPTYTAPTFTTSELTNKYKDKTAEVEGAKPAAYNSLYESTINEILDTIKNRQAFDVNNDANYKALYDQYAERYRANAQRAMNDAMASANAATGGYGSTYGQAVGQQAYDRTMEGLNDNNMALLNLAYQIYEGDRANDYNKLGAYQSADNTAYNRYRNDVGDWQTDRNYYANQYQTNYGNDRSAFENDRNFTYNQYLNDDQNWETDRNFAYTQNRDSMADWENDRNFAYNQYRDNVGDWLNDRNYYAGQYWNGYSTDRSSYEDTRNFDYTADQDEIKRDDANYQDALTQAMALAKEGLPVPSYITDRINQYNAKYGLSGDATAALAQLAATAAAGSGGSGGGSGRGRGRGKSSSSNESTSKNNALPVVNNEDVMSMYNTIKKSNSGTVLDRINADDYLEDVMNNSLIDFAPKLAGYSNFTDQVTRKYSKTGESVTDTLNRLAYEKALKKKK